MLRRSKDLQDGPVTEDEGTASSASNDAVPHADRGGNTDLTRQATT
jgi:hypothetical protein